MKKILFSMFILLMTCMFYPVQIAQAAVKISKTKEELYIGDTVTLKITGTKKDVKWSTSDKNIATVSKKGKVTAKDVGNVTITAKVGDKKYKCKIKVSYDKDKILQETYDWVLYDIYFDTIGCFNRYIGHGTDAYMTPIDDKSIKERLDRLEKAIKKMDKFDKFYSSYDDDEVVEIWNELSEKILYMYDIATNNDIFYGADIDFKYAVDLIYILRKFPAPNKAA